LESTESIDILFLVAAGGTAMTLLAGFIIFFVVLYQKKVIIQRNEVDAIKAKHKQDLLEKTLEVEQKERQSVAKNIHDDLGALISVLRLNNSRIAKNVTNKNVLLEVYEANNVVLKKTSESLRSISKKLASPTLVKLGFESALLEVSNHFNQTGEISMNFKNNLPAKLNLSKKIASHLFRASQEIINNIVRHTTATQVNIDLSAHNNITKIQFKHNGIGISDEDVKNLIVQDKGVGLASIQSRLSIINADIKYNRNNGTNPSVIIFYTNDETKD